MYHATGVGLICEERAKPSVYGVLSNINICFQKAYLFIHSLNNV